MAITSTTKRNTMLILAERDGPNCCICGDPVDLSIYGRGPISPTIEHIIPKARGGPNQLFNLAISHRVCNEKRGTAVLEREQSVPVMIGGIQCNHCGQPLLNTADMDAHRFEKHGELSIRWMIRAPVVDLVAFEADLNARLKLRKERRPSRSQAAFKGHETRKSRARA